MEHARKVRIAEVLSEKSAVAIQMNHHYLKPTIQPWEYSVVDESVMRKINHLPKEPFTHVTVVGVQLGASAEFAKMRIEQQVEYITRYNARMKSRDDRPDRELVLQSAFDMLEYCRKNI